jgi:hypothetical protein
MVVMQRERTARNAGMHAGLSALVPGLGQVAQRRFGTALLQFGTVITYIVSTLGLGGRRALILALAWNLWSVIDAYRHDAD